jgi:hypothetical protein
VPQTDINIPSIEGNDNPRSGFPGYVPANKGKKNISLGNPEMPPGSKVHTQTTTSRLLTLLLLLFKFT